MPDELEMVFRFASNPPVDVEGLIRTLGIEYREEPMPPIQSGWIELDGDTYAIVVNSNEGPQRRRFTAAHELGHYLLHRDLLERRGHLSRHIDQLFGEAAGHNPSSPFSPKHEIQANRFAARLLMPGNEIARLYRDDNYRELADRFGVSAKAMKIRLNNLGLRPTAD